MKKWTYLAGTIVLMGHTGWAGVDKVYSPSVEKGEREIETRGMIVDDRHHADDGYQKTKVELGYGITDAFSLGALLIFEKEKYESSELEAFELEAKLELNEPGASMIDLGLLAEIEKYREDDIWEVKAGPLLQKKFGALTTRLNLLAETSFGDDVEDDGDVESEGRLQAKYEFCDYFAPALEYYIDEDAQSAGPVITGEVEAGENEIEWQAGALFGLDNDSPEVTWRWQFEFKF